MANLTTIHVNGMSCGHCVTAVTDEIEKIDGVTQVAVDLSSGTVEISSANPLDPRQLQGAVEEAGYEVGT